MAKCRTAQISFLPMDSDIFLQQSSMKRLLIMTIMYIWYVFNIINSSEYDTPSDTVAVHMEQQGTTKYLFGSSWVWAVPERTDALPISGKAQLSIVTVHSFKKQKNKTHAQQIRDMNYKQLKWQTPSLRNRWRRTSTLSLVLLYTRFLVCYSYKICSFNLKENFDFRC